MNPSPKKNFRTIGGFIFEVLYNVVIIVALVVVLRTFIISPFRVAGDSMNDTLLNGELILINKIGYIWGEPKRGDVIVFLPPVTGRDEAKFEMDVRTSENAEALKLSEMEAIKQTAYCKKKILQSFWFCKEGVKEGDWLYVLEASSTNQMAGFNWKNSDKRLITAEEIEKNTLTFPESNQNYRIKIYNPTGAEYFVKRIIGLPGDTIRFEENGDEGLVYLKKAGETEFKKLDEPYLNAINFNGTFLPDQLDQNTFVVPEGMYFGMGDNRGYSNDSRSFFAPERTGEHTPFITKEQISGKVMLVLFPLWEIKWIGGHEL